MPTSACCLRLYTADDSPPLRPPGGARGLSPELRLSEFVRRWFVPQYCQKRRRPLAAATVAEFHSAVNRFVELIGDLPLREITCDRCRDFVEFDFGQPGRKVKGGTLSPHTVYKHTAALSMIFTQAGPRTRATPDAASDEGLFGMDRFGRPRAVPWFPPIERPEASADDVFSVAEIRAWIDAARKARQPRLKECRPWAWWQALIIFLYNTGLRIGAALQIRRADVHEADGRWWMDVPGKISKQGKPIQICLSSHAQKALGSIPTRDVIFPFPHTHKHLHTLRHELLAAAGIPEGRRFGFHALRGANGTELFDIDPEAAQVNLGHEDRKTTVGHYVTKARQAKALARKVLPALERLPQPGQASPQRRLFE